MDIEKIYLSLNVLILGIFCGNWLFFSPHQYNRGKTSLKDGLVLLKLINN